MKNPSKEKSERMGCLIGGLVRLFITSPIFRLTMLFVAICLCMVLLMASFHWFLAGHIQNVLESVFGTKPTVRTEAVRLEGIYPASEIVTAKVSGEVRTSMSKPWMGSTKSLEAKAAYTARAVFDFSQTLPTISIGILGDIQRISIPEPTIVLELYDFYYKAENGWWNKVNAKDIEDATNELRPLAVDKIKEAGFLLVAKQELEKKLLEAFPDRVFEIQWIVEISEPLPPMPLL